MPRADGQGQGGGQRPTGTGFNQLSQWCSVRREEEVGAHTWWSGSRAFPRARPAAEHTGEAAPAHASSRTGPNTGPRGTEAVASYLPSPGSALFGRDLQRMGEL